MREVLDASVPMFFLSLPVVTIILVFREPVSHVHMRPGESSPRLSMVSGGKNDVHAITDRYSGFGRGR